MDDDRTKQRVERRTGEVQDQHGGIPGDEGQEAERTPEEVEARLDAQGGKAEDAAPDAATTRKEDAAASE
jgi:uncharacterized protein YjbJ (UPF0337 family)